jgi:hypothetical protein
MWIDKIKYMVPRMNKVVVQGGLFEFFFCFCFCEIGIEESEEMSCGSLRTTAGVFNHMVPSFPLYNIYICLVLHQFTRLCFLKYAVVMYLNACLNVILMLAWDNNLLYAFDTCFKNRSQVTNTQQASYSHNIS